MDDTNVGLIKTAMKQFVAMGRKAKADDFHLDVDGYPNLKFKVKTVQKPPMKRENVEVIGPHGLQVHEPGKIINAHEVPVTFLETVSGDTLRDLRDWVKTADYRTVTLTPLSEAGAADPTVMEWCWFESEAVEFSTDDNTPLNVSGIIHVNWTNDFD